MTLDNNDPPISATAQEVQSKRTYPVPAGCNFKKILKAAQKLRGVNPASIKLSDAALLPLTPMEKGFVLGVLTELHAKEML